MFERRLRIVLIVPIVMGVVILARLAQLQIVRGNHYAQQQEAALIAPRQYLPALRGSILDRTGRVLVSDEPAHDVAVHYGALAMSDRYMGLLADRLRRRNPDLRRADSATVAAEAARMVARMWVELERLTGVQMADLRRRRDTVCRSVEGLRRHLHAARSQSDGPGSPERSIDRLRLREDELFHPIVRDVSPQVRTAIELELADLPFVRVEPSVRRIWHEDVAPLCHVLGRLGQVSAGQLRGDPRADDPLAAYRADDDAGASGVERLCESMLRGKRGYEERFLDTSLKDRVPPQDGLDVQLTIDFDVQRQITEILTTAVAENPHSTGASCVVLDVRTREIIALASVPTFSEADLRGNYAGLRDDAMTVPLRFRAVAEEYQPGSIIKPVSLLAALSSGVIDPSARVFCSGALIPGSARWHCWTHWRGMAGHGEMDAVDAIQNSCNIYFYTIGQKLGADRLTRFYRAFIDGPGAVAADADRPRGTGLIEERSGIIPTRDWLRENRRREPTIADGRNYAIGQGEMQITPLTAANLFATIAAGVHREPTLIANDARPRPEQAIPGVRPRDWDVVRRGVHRCVNEPGGTAYKYARMDSVELCGKTGSAECVPRVTQWRFTFALPPGDTPEAAADAAPGDGNTAVPERSDHAVERGDRPAERTAVVVAPTIEAAREALGLADSVPCVRREVLERFPPPSSPKGTAPTHAWFAGYAPFQRPQIALAVIIEFGGGGGHAAGPVARQVVETLMTGPRPYLPGRSVALGREP